MQGCGESTDSSERVSEDIWGGITDTQGEDRRAWIGALRSSGDDEESQALYAPLPPRLLPQEQGSPPLPLTPSGVWLLPPSLVLIQIGQA